MSTCPECRPHPWNVLSNHRRMMIRIEGELWNIEAISHYLMKVYSNENIVQNKNQSVVVQVNESLEWPWIFNKTSSTGFIPSDRFENATSGINGQKQRDSNYATSSHVSLASQERVGRMIRPTTISIHSPSDVIDDTTNVTQQMRHGTLIPVQGNTMGSELFLISSYFKLG